MNDRLLTWEQAVEWLRNQPEKKGLVNDCYYDDPIEKSASRFHQSQEWQEIAHILRDSFPCRVLDIGAGRGISSYAFSMEGCAVTALEPDASPLVGSAAIKSLADKTKSSIQVIRGYGESLPFKDNSFDIVYGRASMHHAHYLKNLCNEAARVLDKGGIFITTREHVISRPQDLDIFFKSHPLQALYGGENAYLLKEYQAAIKASGLKLRKTIGPYESVINYAPVSKEEHIKNITSLFRRFMGNKASHFLASFPITVKCISMYLSRRSTLPGRLYSFIAVKP
jgi:ubiquinone/menaquinone biosynthesis C-methylase UbiE